MTTAQAPAYLADTHTGLPLPTPPRFADPADERAHRKLRLTAALRIFGRLGFGEGISGHISVRDPEHRDRFWVNPFGVSFKLMTPSDLICVDASGAVVEGKHRVNPSAFVIHAAIHERNPEAEAAAHAHTVNSRALGALERVLEPLDQESAAFYEDHVLYTGYEGPSVSLEQGQDIADHLGDAKAILLKHHGLITVGSTLEAAIHWFLTFDSCAEVQLAALAAGTPVPMTREQALSAKDGFGDNQLAWFSFQLLYDELAHEQPDVFGHA
ncbi:class II aldolase/adducin family protein [Knoellia sp. CPCC 206453]|uniref:class II aldolase/adducin family protein n=1 Tax=Knoellia pratensis TaxID=3404796 RepID=UPI003611FC27